MKQGKIKKLWKYPLSAVIIVVYILPVTRGNDVLQTITDGSAGCPAQRMVFQKLHQGIP
jgi:hypothetical protein